MFTIPAGLILWNTNQLYLPCRHGDTNLSPNPRTQHAWCAGNMLGKYINISCNLHLKLVVRNHEIGQAMMLPWTPDMRRQWLFNDMRRRLSRNPMTIVAIHFRPMVFSLSSKKSTSRSQKTKQEQRKFPANMVEQC